MTRSSADKQQRRSGAGNDTNRRLAVLTVAVALAASLVVVSAAEWSIHQREGTYGHHYYVRVETLNDNNYTIILPLPIDISGSYPASFLHEIKVTIGNPSLAIAAYSHGIGLEVKASGSLEFEWSKAWPKSSNVKYGNLTMTSGADGWEHTSQSHQTYSWVFSSRSDVRIQLHYSMIHRYMASPTWASGGGPTFSFIEYPNGTGWQQMPIDYGWLVLN